MPSPLFAGHLGRPHPAAGLPAPARMPARGSRERTREASAGGEGGSRALWVLVLAAAWRWRRELAPGALAVALVIGLAIGHAAFEGLAWAPLLAGAGGVGAVALWGHRPIHRWYAAGSVAGGLWSAAAWWVGLTDPVVGLGFVVLLVATLTVWIRYVHPRARVRVFGGSALPWFGHRWDRWQFERRTRRETRRAMERWLVASYWGNVPRSEIRAAVANFEDDYRDLTVELVPGRLDADLDNRRAASAIGAAIRDVAIMRAARDSDQPADVVIVRWYYDGLPPVGEDAEEAPRAEDDPRIGLLAAALDAEPRPGREVAARAELPYDEWLWREALPELVGRGLAEKAEKGWRRPAAAAAEQR